MAEPVTMWVSTSSRMRAHPERVLDAFLAVDDEAARQDVEDLAVGRDRHRPGDLGGPVDVLAGDLAAVTADGDRAARVLALDVLPADADEGPVDRPARQSLGLLHGGRDRLDGLLDVDDHALLQAGRRDRALADDREPAVPADLADERGDLRRADVDPDQDRFSFHVISLPLVYRKWRRMRATFWKIRGPKVISATR